MPINISCWARLIEFRVEMSLLYGKLRFSEGAMRACSVERFHLELNE